MSTSILLFFIGVVIYGIIINLREITLVEAMQKKGITEIKNVSIIVDRKNYKLELYSNSKLLKTYKAVFGKNNGSVKTSAFDNVTPAGDYSVCEIDTNYIYHKFIRLNYPNQRDAFEAYKNNFINEVELKSIIEAVKNNDCLPVNTYLGGDIGIHGIGRFNFIFKNLPFIYNWTNGSVAVSDDNVDELVSVVKVGTNVLIRN